jgi:hypothetical protein
VVRVELTSALTDEQKAAVLRYLGEAERFSSAEWVTLLEAFTTLHDSTVQLEEATLSFQVFYERLVDRKSSDQFIAELLANTDVSVQASALQARYARQIYQQLRSPPYVLGSTPESECLLAYCLYWWASFARGYTFEWETFRDLTDAGIRFVAHDLLVREQRRSPVDLMVLDLMGDVKSTTYFLYVARSFPLTCDFYITRIYHGAEQRYVRIALLTGEAWRRIDGDTVSGDLARAPSLLPQVVGITFLGYDLIVVDYEVWKQKILQRQREGDERP